MKILSRLFDYFDRIKAECTFKETENKVGEMYKPIGDISVAIVKASHVCAEQANSMLNIPDEKEKKEAEILVFYEFLYFFMHLTMRFAFSQLTKEQLAKLQRHLGPCISSVAVDSFFDHWPENLKEKMGNEFYEKLNDAELEYANCKELFSEKDPITGDSLFSKLARNVADLSGNSMNPIVVVRIVSSAADSWKEMELHSLVNTAGRVL